MNFDNVSTPTQDENPWPVSALAFGDALAQAANVAGVSGVAATLPPKPSRVKGTPKPCSVVNLPEGTVLLQKKGVPLFLIKGGRLYNISKNYFFMLYGVF